MFQRNGSAESSRWKTNADEFRGYMRAKLEDIEETQTSQWKAIHATDKRVKWLETKAQFALGGLALLNIILIGIVTASQLGLLQFLGGI